MNTYTAGQLSRILANIPPGSTVVLEMLMTDRKTHRGNLQFVTSDSPDDLFVLSAEANPVEEQACGKKYTRPKDLPGRVCRVLEGHTMLEMSEDPFHVMVYRFTHLASGRCPHDGEMAEFEKMEAEIEEVAYTSPAERKRRDSAAEEN